MTLTLLSGSIVCNTHIILHFIKKKKYSYYTFSYFMKKKIVPPNWNLQGICCNTKMWKSDCCFRHPKVCKWLNSNHGCKRDDCSYLHVTPASATMGGARKPRVWWLPLLLHLDGHSSFWQSDVLDWNGKDLAGQQLHIVILWVEIPHT